MNPPLSYINSHQSLAVDITIFSLHLAGISSLLGSINFIITILNMRAPGLAMHSIQLFSWSIGVNPYVPILIVP